MEYFYFLILYISISFGYEIPEPFKLCHRSHKDYGECVGKYLRIGLESFKNGNKEMGLPVLDPYFIEKLELTPPSTSDSTIAIHLTLTSGHVIGWTATDAVHMEVDFDKKCGWTIDAYSPCISVDGDYKLNGRLLLFGLNSHGKANVSLIHLHNTHRMWCEKYQKRGKTYLRFTNYTLDMHPENVIFHFSNIFPTNKAIEKEIYKTVDENSMEIFKEIRGACEKLFAKIHIQLANAVLSRIPFEEGFLF